MDDVLTFKSSQLAGISFSCSCGREHSVEIKAIDIGPGRLSAVSDYAEKYAGAVFLAADENTWKVAGETIEAALKQRGIPVSSYVFHTPGHLTPDEYALGSLLVALPAHTSLIIAAGSGTLNDLCRMLSYKTKIPYLIAATAPSMDGYASTVSPLCINRFKSTYEAVYPDVIVADTGLLKDAPWEMIHAGFGDLIGKYNALTDWVLSREKNGEYYCETTAQLVRNALEECVQSMDGVTRREESAIRRMIEALILSGVAIGLVGNSRPASGAEHHMAHYWEIDALKNDREHPLHGNSVGAATVVTACIYEALADKIPRACTPKKPGEISAMLRRVGACDNPRDLGISRELFYESVLHAKEIRPRYTILSFASELGCLQELAKELTDRFY